VSSPSTHEQSRTPRAVPVARPTIRIDGSENERARELLLGMTMLEQEGGMSSLELRFANWASLLDGTAEHAFEDEQILKLGAVITIYAGEEGDPQELFRGKITGFELELAQKSGPELVVFAEDALQLARMLRKTQCHSDTTIASVAQEVAREVGLTPVITGFTDNIGTHMQLNESSLAFLRRLLANYDGDLQVVGAELHVSPREDVRRDTLPLEMFDAVTRLRITADLAHQTSGITVTGWDPERAQKIREASHARALGPGNGRTGAALLESSIGPRTEHIGHVAVVTESEARAVADACFAQRARRFVLVEATMAGNTALRVGTHVTLAGVSRRFDNSFYVTKACHRYDQKRGYLTDFEAECAYLGDA
jgi:phage protein D